VPALLEATTDALNNIDDLEDDGLEGSGINPILELNARLEHSRITGEYYRGVSANYGDLRAEYERTGAWPEHPFPNERYIFGNVLDF
jgi:hypothetical protein